MDTNLSTKEYLSNAFDVLASAADLGQKGGVYTLQDAKKIAGALEQLAVYIHELPEEDQE